jgi:hypothetical protein
LQQIKNQLPEIEARLDALGSSSVADQPMTRRGWKVRKELA